MTKSFDWPIKVYIEDTDAGGVVFYANYLKFMERARTEMLLADGIDHAGMMRDDGLMFVVTRLEVDYKRPARLGDPLVLSTSVVEKSLVSFKLRQIVKKGDTTLAEGMITLACVSTDLKLCRIPASILEKIG